MFKGNFVQCVIIQRPTPRALPQNDSDLAARPLVSPADLSRKGARVQIGCRKHGWLVTGSEALPMAGRVSSRFRPTVAIFCHYLDCDVRAWDCHTERVTDVCDSPLPLLCECS